MNKQELRAHYLSLRSQLSEERKQEAAKHLFQKLQSISFDRLASFCSTKGEIDLQKINEHYASLGRLLLPRRSEKSLKYFLVTDLSALEPSPYGLREPIPDLNTASALTKRDLILVPGLAFDSEHFRLGYGKGHFDRFLSEHPSVPTAAVGYREQLSVTPLPRDPWDLPVQTLLLF